MTSFKKIHVVKVHGVCWSEDLEDKLVDLWQQYVHIAETVGSRQSSWASCEFMYTYRRRRRDATRQFRRVGGVLEVILSMSFTTRILRTVALAVQAYCILWY